MSSKATHHEHVFVGSRRFTVIYEMDGHGLVIADVFRADAPREGETLAPTVQERADAIVNLYAYIESGPPPF